MSVDKLKIAVIGVGKMGEFHLEKYLRIPEIEVIGFYEASEKRARQIQEKHSVKSFTNLSELLFEADAVSIASPTSTHYSIAKLALDAGVHALVEKPICETEIQAEELIKIAATNKLILQVGLVERFRFLKLQKQLEFSAPWLLEASWLSPTLPRETDIDVINDLVVHPLDLVLSVMNEEPAEISATGTAVITKLVDIANIRLEFSRGAVANITGSRVAGHRERRFNLFSHGTHSHFNFLSNHVDVLTFIGGTANRSTFGLDDSHGLQPDVLYDQCVAFIQACKSLTRPVVTGEDGLRVIRVARKIRESIIKHSSRHLEGSSLEVLDGI